MKAPSFKRRENSSVSSAVSSMHDPFEFHRRLERMAKRVHTMLEGIKQIETSLKPCEKGRPAALPPHLCWKVQSQLFLALQRTEEAEISLSRAILQFNRGDSTQAAMECTYSPVNDLFGAYTELCKVFRDCRKAHRFMLHAGGTEAVNKGMNPTQIGPHPASVTSLSDSNVCKRSPLANSDRYRKYIPVMLSRIGQAYDVNEKGIGNLLSVDQSTISRWRNLELEPSEDHLDRIMSRFYEACTVVRNSFPVPASLDYVCSFANNYPDSRAQEAQKALQATVFGWIEKGTSVGTGVNMHLSILPAQLPVGVRAHCFVDDHEKPRLVVVLVNSTLSDAEQYHVAFDEVYAHISHRLSDRQRTIVQPDPLIP